MNNARRKQIDALIDALEQAKTTVEDVHADEEAYYDAMPDNLRDGEKGERASGNVECLSSAADSIQEAIEQLQSATE